MRILLTGRTGQLARALSAPLARFGTVHETDRAALDLSDAAAIPTALDRIRPDLIVNAAAYTAVDRAETESDLVFAVNAHAPEALARWTARHGGALVHVSTDYVYSGAGETPWREDDAPAPLNLYGRSKLAGDEAIMASGCAFVILRTNWVYGASGRNFVSSIAAAAARAEELHVVADQVGAPTSVDVLADVLAAILAQGPDAQAAIRAKPGLVHAAARGDTSRFDFARAIIDGLRARGTALACRRILPTVTAARPGEAARPLNSRLDLARLASRYRLTTPDWREALERVLDRIALAPTA